MLYVLFLLAWLSRYSSPQLHHRPHITTAATSPIDTIFATILHHPSHPSTNFTQHNISSNPPLTLAIAPLRSSTVPPIQQHLHRPCSVYCFVQRIAEHVADQHDAAGLLYDTDLRLRPDGAAGLLVSSIDAFRAYQREQGVDVGAPGADARALRRRRRRASARRSSRSASRSCACRAIAAKLADDVVAMRERMQAGHPNRTRAVRPEARSGRHGRHRVRRRSTWCSRMRTRIPR